MKHFWSILCENSTVDADSNLISIYNCLEELQIALDKGKLKQVEAVNLPIAMQIVSYFVTEAEKVKMTEFEVIIELIDPNQKKLLKLENKVPVKEGVKRIRNRMKLQGLPVTTSGRYYFYIYKKEAGKKSEKVAELPLDIKIEYKDVRRVE